MSKSANSGELRTKIRFMRIDRVTDNDGFDAEDEVNVFGCSSAYVKCKWVNAHGTDAFVAMQMQLREPATITCRFSPLINERCLVYKEDETSPYEIISIDNVEERNRWLEIKVQRKVSAR